MTCLMPCRGRFVTIRLPVTNPQSPWAAFSWIRRISPSRRSASAAAAQVLPYKVAYTFASDTVPPIKLACALYPRLVG